MANPGRSTGLLVFSNGQTGHFLDQQVTEHVIKSIGNVWKDLGKTMGLSERQLNQIQIQNWSRGREIMSLEVIRTWMEAQKQDATIESLAKHLRDVNLNTLANKILQDASLFNADQSGIADAKELGKSSTEIQKIQSEMHQEDIFQEFQSIQSESVLERVNVLLESANNPVALMCQALGLPELEAKEFDKFLAHNFKKKGTLKSWNLIKSSSDISASNKPEMMPTLLHFAANYGLQELCTCLLEHPTSSLACSIRNSFGQTPAQLAAAAGYPALTTLLENAVISTEPTEFHHLLDDSSCIPTYDSAKKFWMSQDSFPNAYLSASSQAIKDINDPSKRRRSYISDTSITLSSPFSHDLKNQSGKYLPRPCESIQIINNDHIGTEKEIISYQANKVVSDTNYRRLHLSKSVESITTSCYADESRNRITSSMAHATMPTMSQRIETFNAKGDCAPSLHSSHKSYATKRSESDARKGHNTHLPLKNKEASEMNKEQKPVHNSSDIQLKCGTTDKGDIDQQKLENSHPDLIPVKEINSDGRVKLGQYVSPSGQVDHSSGQLTASKGDQNMACKYVPFSSESLPKLLTFGEYERDVIVNDQQDVYVPLQKGISPISCDAHIYNSKQNPCVPLVHPVVEHESAVGFKINFSNDERGVFVPKPYKAIPSSRTTSEKYTNKEECGIGLDAGDTISPPVIHSENNEVDPDGFYVPISFLVKDGSNDVTENEERGSNQPMACEATTAPYQMTQDSRTANDSEAIYVPMVIRKKDSIVKGLQPHERLLLGLEDDFQPVVDPEYEDPNPNNESSSITTPKANLRGYAQSQIELLNTLEDFKQNRLSLEEVEEHFEKWKAKHQQQTGIKDKSKAKKKQTLHFDRLVFALVPKKNKNSTSSKSETGKTLDS